MLIQKAKTSTHHLVVESHQYGQGGGPKGSGTGQQPEVKAEGKFCSSPTHKDTESTWQHKPLQCEDDKI